MVLGLKHLARIGSGILVGGIHIHRIPYFPTHKDMGEVPDMEDMKRNLLELASATKLAISTLEHEGLLATYLQVISPIS